MIFSSGLSAFGSDPGKSDSVRLQNLCTMLFSMFVSLPTGQVFRKRTVSSFFRIGPTLVIGTFARCEALFSFSSANFYIISSISTSVNSFFHFFIFLSADLWSDVAAVFAAKFIIEISSTSVNRKFIFRFFPEPQIRHLSVVLTYSFYFSSASSQSCLN